MLLAKSQPLIPAAVKVEPDVAFVYFYAQLVEIWHEVKVKNELEEKA